MQIPKHEFDLPIATLDEFDDAIWGLVQLMARKVGIHDLTNDEFDNEMIQSIRGDILNHLGYVKAWRDAQ